MIKHVKRRLFSVVVFSAVKPLVFDESLPDFKIKILASTATTVEQYLQELPEHRKTAMQKLRATILINLPAGFEEVIAYGMLGYVVPHSIYPTGYYCNSKLPLPFISLASQKNNISLHHLGI
jgi:hypothetical protein